MRDTERTEGELVKSFDEFENLIEVNNNKKTKKIFILISIISIIIAFIIVFLILLFTVFKKADNENDKEENYDDPYQLDNIPKEEMNKARNSFKQYVFNYDTQNLQKTINYNLFIPENYTTNKKYPLIVFIGDASTVGIETNLPLIESVGGPIWATNTMQKEHECFVLVPQYKEIIIDDRNGYSKSEYINITIKLIFELLNTYNIDSNKIYGTGQSMGAMTTLYILANYPDLYAAGLIVDGQWKIDELKGLVNATFTYFAAEGDEKAYNGQNEVKNYFDNNNISYNSLYDINAQEEIIILNNLTNDMYNSKNQRNFITYLKGTVFPNNSKSIYDNEHMASFKYGYRIDRVREWLFEQNKMKCPDGLYYSEDGKCSITNYCSLSRNDHSCRKCVYGYYLSLNNICTNDVNCYHGDKKTGLCMSCDFNYYLDLQEKKCKSNLEEEKYNFCSFVDNGICTKCENFYHLTEDKKCSITENCAVSKNSLCQKCIDGYYLGLDNKCTDVEKCIYSEESICSECENGFYYDQHDKLCKEAEGNFTNCRINSFYDQGLCDCCKDNYYINQSDHQCYDNTKDGPYYKCLVAQICTEFCKICVDGYYLGKLDYNCTKIEGCVSSLDENTCLKCDNYYCYDYTGNCTDNNHVINEDKKYFFRCKVLNKSGNGCEECDFNLNKTRDGICYDDIHCEIFNEEGECVKCLEDNHHDYISYCLNKEFGCVESRYYNCIRCDNINDLNYCTQCREGYEPNRFGECISIE